MLSCMRITTQMDYFWIKKILRHGSHFGSKIFRWGSHFKKIWKKYKIYHFWGRKTLRNWTTLAKILKQPSNQLYIEWEKSSGRGFRPWQRSETRPHIPWKNNTCLLHAPEDWPRSRCIMVYVQVLCSSDILLSDYSYKSVKEWNTQSAFRLAWSIDGDIDCARATCCRSKTKW